MFAQAFAIRLPQRDDRVVRAHDDEADDGDDEDDREQGGAGLGAHDRAMIGHGTRQRTVIAPPAATATPIAPAIASTAPRRPCRNRPSSRATTSPGAPCAMRSGESGPAASTRRSGSRSNTRSIRAASSADARTGAAASGSQLGLPDGPADPEPRDRGVPPRLLGRRQDPRLACLGDVHRDLRVVERHQRIAEPVEVVRPVRIVEVPERERGADHGHDVAELEAGLLVPAPTFAAELVEVVAGIRMPDGEECRDGRLPIAGDPGVERRRRAHRHRQGSLARRGVTLVEADRGVDPRASREDADRPTPVADPKADRSLLVQEPAAVVALGRHARAVPDAFATLEAGGDRDLRGLDDDP